MEATADMVLVALGDKMIAVPPFKTTLETAGPPALGVNGPVDVPTA